MDTRRLKLIRIKKEISHSRQTRCSQTWQNGMPGTGYGNPESTPWNSAAPTTAVHRTIHNIIIVVAAYVLVIARMMCGLLNLGYFTMTNIQFRYYTKDLILE
jgi:hypothetical protein